MKFSTIVLSVALGTTSAFTGNYAKLSRPSGSISASSLESVEETTAAPAVVKTEEKMEKIITSPVKSSEDPIAVPLKTIDQAMKEEATSVDRIMP
jgi:hypothetical protein